MRRIYFYEIPENHDKSLTPSTIAKMIVKSVAKSILNIKDSQIIIEYTNSGKPFLKNFPDFNFNISHCKNAVAVAFSNLPIGIDIEKISKCKPKVAKRYFSPLENEYINQNIDCNYAFFEIWTKKEAFLKYKGTGIGSSFSKLCIFENEIKDNFFTIKHNDYLISIYCNDKSKPEFKILNTDFFDDI